MVTYDNYEEYLMMDADGELSANEKAALEVFLDDNPDLRAEGAIWYSLKLEPGPQMVYPNKHLLLKKGKSRLLTYRPYIMAAAAAITGLLILIPALQRFRGDQRQTSFTHVFNVQSSKPNVPVPVSAGDQAIPDQQPEQTAPVRAAVATTNNKQYATTQTAPVPDSLSALAINSSTQGTEIPAYVSPQVVQSTDRVAQVQLPEAQQQETGFPRIAFAEQNQPALSLFKRAFDERRNQAAAAAKSFKETALVVKIGNGSVNFNF